MQKTIMNNINIINLFITQIIQRMCDQSRTNYIYIYIYIYTYIYKYVFKTFAYSIQYCKQI